MSPGYPTRMKQYFVLLKPQHHPSITYQFLPSGCESQHPWTTRIFLWFFPFSSSRTLGFFSTPYFRQWISHPRAINELKKKKEKRKTQEQGYVSVFILLLPLCNECVKSCWSLYLVDVCAPFSSTHYSPT